MLWMIDMQKLASIGAQNTAIGAARQTYGQRQVTTQLLNAAYENGTLHLISIAPKKYYSTRITLEPDLEKSGKYLGVVLGWLVIACISTPL